MTADWFTGGTPQVDRARNKAREIASQYGFNPKDIPLKLLAWHVYKAVIEEKATKSCAARVARGKRASVIAVQRSSNIGRKRFSIAHETGHIALHPTINQLALCSSADIFSYNKARPQEREANYFATELLMPESLFGPLCEEYDPTLELIREVSDDFKVSITAAACRVVELTSEPCAIVKSEGQVIKWCFKSRTFRHHLRSGRLDGASHAVRLKSDNLGGMLESAEIPASCWLARPGQCCEFFWEESMNLGRYGRLTLIWDY